MVSKAPAVMRHVWEIGKRRFGKKWEEKLWLFHRFYKLVQTKRLKEKYLR